MFGCLNHPRVSVTFPSLQLLITVRGKHRKTGKYQQFPRRSNICHPVIWHRAQWVTCQIWGTIYETLSFMLPRSAKINFRRRAAISKARAAAGSLLPDGCGHKRRDPGMDGSAPGALLSFLLLGSPGLEQTFRQGCSQVLPQLHRFEKTPFSAIPKQL